MNGDIRLPLIVIAGPTASGKTGLAIRLAREFGGEIICADSRTVYTGLDIGTAKPSPKEQAGVPHWGLDLVEPGEIFTAADFKEYATSKIEEIRSRGKIPFLVGGTGLYIDGVIFDYKFGAEADKDRRAELEKKDIKSLQKYCTTNNIPLPENATNKRYIIRAIEQNGVNEQRQEQPIENCYVVGIATDKSILRTRISDRAEQLFDQGMVQEAIDCGKKYGWKSEAMTGNIYRLTYEYVQGLHSYEELKQKFITSDWQLAKRQLTWLRRNPFIHWMELHDAESQLQQYLAKRT